MTPQAVNLVTSLDVITRQQLRAMTSHHVTLRHVTYYGKHLKDFGRSDGEVSREAALNIFHHYKHEQAHSCFATCVSFVDGRHVSKRKYEPVLTRRTARLRSSLSHGTTSV